MGLCWPWGLPQPFPPPLCSLSLVSLCSPHIRRQCHVQRTEGRGGTIALTELGVCLLHAALLHFNCASSHHSHGEGKKKARRGLDGYQETQPIKKLLMKPQGLQVHRPEGPWALSITPSNHGRESRRARQVPAEGQGRRQWA